MRTGSHPRPFRPPAVVVGTLLAVVVVFLVGVSVFAEGPAPSIGPRGEDVATAVTPTTLR